MISMVLEGNSASLTEPELAALKEGVLDKLLSKLSSNAAPIDRSQMFVKLSRESPQFTAEAFFKPGSGVDIAEAHAIAAAIEADSGGPYHFVTPDAGLTEYPIVSASAQHSSQPPTMAPSFSPAMPMISMVLEGNSASMTEPELAALKEAVLDKLLSNLSSNAAPIDRSQMFVKLSRESPQFTAEAFFKPGSGVDIA